MEGLHNMVSNYESYKRYEEAKQRHYEWLRNTSTLSHHQVEALYEASLIGMSRFLSEVLANYDTTALIISTVIVFQVVCMLGLRLAGSQFPAWCSVRPALQLSAGVSVAVTACCHLISLYCLSFPLLLATVLLITFNVFLLHLQLKTIPAVFTISTFQTTFSWYIMVPIGTALFSISLFSSSLIEEEHQLWYFLWATLATTRLIEGPRWLCVLVAHRLLRALNQTGDRWAHLPDLSDWLTAPENKLALSGFCVTSLACLRWCCGKVANHGLSVLLYFTIGLCIYLHKAAVQQAIAFTPFVSRSGVMEARLCFVLLSLVLLLGRSLDSLVACWMLVSSLLLRSHNTVLVPSLFFFSKALSSSNSSTSFNTALHHWLGAVFFFYQGNSNSLASVDLAAGYVGLEEYNIVLVGVLLLSHTYCMPVLAYLLNIHSIVRRSRNTREELARSGEVVVFLQLTHVFFCLSAITLHRYHLFVWTVFSPKMLYLAAQTLVYFLLVSITNVCIYLSMK